MDTTKTKYSKKDTKTNPSNNPKPIRGTKYYRCGIFKVADTICECGECYSDLEENNPLQAQTTVQATLHIILDISSKEALRKNEEGYAKATKLLKCLAEYQTIDEIFTTLTKSNPDMKKEFLVAIEKHFDVPTVFNALALYCNMLEAINNITTDEYKKQH